MIRLEKNDRLTVKVARAPLWIVVAGIEEKVLLEPGEWTVVSTYEYDALRLRVQLAAEMEAERGEVAGSGVESRVRQVQARSAGRRHAPDVGQRRRHVSPVRRVSRAAVLEAVAVEFAGLAAYGLGRLVRWWRLR
jgi:hypothetical protein